MDIRIDIHTLQRAQERGASADEIHDVIETGIEFAGKRGRYGKAKVYDFRANRAGRYYEQKRVEVIYVVENTIVTTVTVYVFYGKWEETK